LFQPPSGYWGQWWLAPGLAIYEMLSWFPSSQHGVCLPSPGMTVVERIFPAENVNSIRINYYQFFNPLVINYFTWNIQQNISKTNRLQFNTLDSPFIIILFSWPKMSYFGTLQINSKQPHSLILHGIKFLHCVSTDLRTFLKCWIHPLQTSIQLYDSQCESASLSLTTCHFKQKEILLYLKTSDQAQYHLQLAS
jgi:hypothetical protein